METRINSFGMCVNPSNLQSNVGIRVVDEPSVAVSGLLSRDYCDILDEWVVHEDGSSIGIRMEARARILFNMDFSTVTKLDLGGLGLKSIPPLFKLINLEYLFLSHNLLSRIDSNSFTKNIKLKYLNLSNNQFKDFGLDSSICSSSIRFVFLNFNLLTELKSHYFKHLPDLEILDLTDNAISSIEDATFLYQSNLEQLDMKCNEISFFSPLLFHQLSKIRILNLNCNKITRFDFPVEIKSQPYISLQGNPICSKVARVLFESQYECNYQGPYYALSILFESSGMIISFYQGDSFGSGVKSLRFGDYLIKLNDWVEFDDVTFYEKKVMAQSIIKNFLERPVYQQQCLNLRCLSLYSFPPIGGFSYLFSLDLSSNNLKNFEPNIFSSCPLLRKLLLTNNCFSELVPGQFSFLPDLQFLDLSHNSFTSLSQDYFSDLTKLASLDLSKNFISELDSEVFAKQMVLNYLYLDKNEIRSMSSQLLRNLVRLKLLDLSFNLLTRFDWPSENNAHPLIRLEGNQFSLDRVADLNAIQNVMGYIGPTFQVSIYDVSSYAVADVSLDSLMHTLALWGIDDPSKHWFSLLEDLSEQNKRLYNAFNIFLLRLFNEVPRTSEGQVSKGVSYHVSKVLSILETYELDFDLFSYCVCMAADGIKECVDRVGVTLIQMSLYAQRFDADKKGDLHLSKCILSQIDLLNLVQNFVNDVDDYKIVFDVDKSEFLRLSSLQSEGVYQENVQMMISLDDADKTTRQCAIVCLNQLGSHLRFFNIGDQVEDILLIVNKMKERGICDIEVIDMRFGDVATLRDHIDSVFKYLNLTFIS